MFSINGVSLAYSLSEIHERKYQILERKKGRFKELNKNT